MKKISTMVIEKYSRDYKNLNQNELQVILKHHDPNYQTRNYRSKEELISAIVKFIPEFNHSSNLNSYFFQLDTSNGTISWFTDQSEIDVNSYPFKPNTHKNQLSDRLTIKTPENRPSSENSPSAELDQTFHSVNNQNFLLSDREIPNSKPFGNIKFKVQYSDERGIESF